MFVSQEGKSVLRRFCLIAMGIPAVLLILVLAVYFSPWALDKAQVSSSVLNVAAACLGLVGLGIWIFFSYFLYRRLCKVYLAVSDREKAVSFAMGVFGLLGVGTSMLSVLGLFYYLFSGDAARGASLIAVSIVLALVESIRFPTRFEEVERNIVEFE